MIEDLRIPIVFSTDHNYILQTGVSIASLLDSAEETKYDINIIISNNVTDADKELLEKQVSCFLGHRISFLEQPNDFDSSYETRGISTACYYRLLIPWLLPHLDKVIYSDGDVIFRTTLKEVFNINLGENLAGAPAAVGLRTSRRGINHCKHNKFILEKYHNSGFLLLNSFQWRKENLKERIKELAKKKYTYQDQDILNIIAENRLYTVSARYCILPSFYEMVIKKDPRIQTYYGDQEQIDRICRNEDCILHYGGRPKPWDGFNYGYSAWWDTYRKSIFFNPRFEFEKNKDIISHNLPWKVLFKSMLKKIFGSKRF